MLCDSIYKYGHRHTYIRSFVHFMVKILILFIHPSSNAYCVLGVVLTIHDL